MSREWERCAQEDSLRCMSWPECVCGYVNVEPTVPLTGAVAPQRWVLAPPAAMRPQNDVSAPYVVTGAPTWVVGKRARGR